MVAASNNYSPHEGDDALAPSRVRKRAEAIGYDDVAEELALPGVVNQRVYHCLAESGGWLNEAYLAQRYYRSDQHRRHLGQRDRNRIQHIVNHIRRDVDLMVADVLDGEPVVVPVGRNPKHFQLGELLLQVLDWTRDEEENWDSDLERVITDCFHIGEGVLYEGWDQEADNGRGMPISMWLDSRYVFWDPKARRTFQRDDAEYVLWLEQERVDKVEMMYPHLQGQIQPENEETFLLPTFQGNRRHRAAGSRLAHAPMTSEEDRTVWIRRMWSKKYRYEKRYFLEENGEPATVVVDEEEVPLDDALFAELAEEDQEQVVSTRHRVEELWETVVVNNHLVEHRLSPFDRSNGGHGKFPFAFFSYVHLADESHARGEIGFLVGTQDITNYSVSMFLEQLHMNNVGYWHTYKGALDPENRSKLNRVGSHPGQVIEGQLGTPPPQHVGVNPAGMQAAAQSMGIIQGWMNKVSGVQDPFRGQAVSPDQSGRAIRALQAQTSQLSTKVKRHIESGLRRSTLLRLHNIMQFMRGNRVAEVTDTNTRESVPLFIGHNALEVATLNNLLPAEGEEGGIEWTTQDGKPVKIMELNDKIAGDVIFERVKLTLDTGQEKNKLERMDQAEMVLRTVGRAAVRWAGRMMEWPNMDLLEEEMDKEDQAGQIVQQLEEISKVTGQDIPSLLQALQAVAQQADAGAEGPQTQGGAPPAPAGPPQAVAA